MLVVTPNPLKWWGFPHWQATPFIGGHLQLILNLLFRNVFRVGSRVMPKDCVPVPKLFYLPASSFVLTWGSSSKAADKGARMVKGPGPTRSRTECSCGEDRWGPHAMYWVGQKVRSNFFVPSYGKTQMNFLANPIHNVSKGRGSDK